MNYFLLWEENLKLYKAKEFDAVTGKGVKAKISLSPKRLVLVGNRKLMEEENIDYKSLEDDVKRLEGEAKTAMLVAVNRKIAGAVAVADTLKPDSVQAIRELERLGLITTMLT